MSMLIGIDPGAKGAIAILRPLSLEVLDIPEPHELAELLRELRDEVSPEGTSPVQPDLFAVIERAQSMPGQGVASSFHYGRDYGTILGILTALRIPYETVPPATWKKRMGVTADKAATREAASRIWPMQRFRRADHAESALLALYWERTNRPRVSA